jgi:protein gp37
MANRYSGLTKGKPPKFNGKIRLMHNDLQKPLLTKKPQVWAIWNDLFHENVDWHFIDQALTVIAMCPQHTFLLLTKRIRTAWEYFVKRPTFSYVETKYKLIRPDIVASEQRPRYLPEEFEWPLPNLWIGTTAENQKRADERIPVLLQIPAAVRFVSIEPMVAAVDLAGDNGGQHYFPFENEHGTITPGIDWVVCGGESGSNARPIDPDWPRAIRDQCQAARVPFFMKQFSGRTKAERQAIPNDLMIREYPK